MRLAQWQNSFMEALGSEGCDEEFLSLINPRESARLEIYRNNTIQALKATLIKAFPICERIVGERCFAQMAQDYLKLNPMRESNLNDYGEGFPFFLEGILEKNAAFIGLEYLAELVQLERLLLKSYYARDGVDCLTFADIAGVDERLQADVIMILKPDLFIQGSSFPLYEIWLNHQQHNDNVDIEIPQDHYHFCIYRDPFKPQVERISRSEYELLRAIDAEETLGEMTQSSYDTTRLTEFIGKGWICGFRLREPR